jgi:hypothetical protein
MSRINLDPETEQKAIDARWKELNLKTQRHELEASRIVAKTEVLDKRWAEVTRPARPAAGA